ncbi:MAG: DUF1295 domain-containing protein [Spirochaetes bacterium]|nr:DUF1295 domain-containing protein [Spirochaetota bacterium]
MNLSSLFPTEWPWFFALTLAISATGFIRLVYFVSIGYAFSITALAVLAGALFYRQLGPLAWAHLGLLALYGVRLGTFLVSRERSPSYQTELDEVQRRNRKMSIFTRFGIWISVALLYLCMFSPGLLRAHALAQGRAEPLPWLTILGLAVMAGGLGLEGLADFQKSRFKKTAPKRFCDRGLFRLVRCPNYLGEITIWSGSLLAGISAWNHPLQAVPGILGTICIVLIMMGSTKRLETKQDARYGSDPEYQAYVKKVPVLFPFLPIYSLKNIKVYLE